MPRPKDLPPPGAYAEPQADENVGRDVGADAGNMGAISNPFVTERGAYRARLPKLASREGEFVVILEHRILGIYPTYEAALGAGYDAFGLHTPFFVQRINTTEDVAEVSPDV